MKFDVNSPTHAAWLLLMLASAFVLLALLYWSGLNGPFLLDDMGSTNVIRSVSFNWVDLYYDITHNASGLFGRPVSVFSLALSKILHGASSWGFKYHNLLLHMLNGLLIFWMLTKLLPSLIPATDRNTLVAVAFVAMLLWLFHPLMVSTVLYAVQRMAQLSVLFTLAAVITYLYLRELLAAGIRVFVLVLALFLLLLLLAVLSKENGALVLVYVLLIEFLLFDPARSGPLERRRLGAFFAVFVFAPLVLGAVYLLTHFGRFFDYSFRDFTMAERAMTQLHVMVFYLKLVLLPTISDMSLFHDGWQPVRSLGPATLLLAAFWIVMAALVFLLRRRAPVVAFGIGWFLVSHLMESTVFALELVFEHRNYLAAAGILLIPVYYLFAYWEARRAGGLVLVFLLLFGFMTKARVSEWQSDEMIYSIAVRDHPESIRARIPYSGIQYNRGNFEEAISQVRTAAEIDGKSTSAIVINMLYLCGRNRLEEIDQLFDEGIRRAALYPATPQSISAVDLIHGQIQRGRCRELVSTRMLEWLQAARDQEANKNNQMFTGYIQRQQGYYYYVLGDRAKGYAHMIAAFENTGMASILGEIIDVEIQLGAFATAEHLINLLAELNEERFGTETALLEQRRRQYQDAVARQGAQ